MNTDKECAFCGEEFIPKRSDAKFCSESCKQKAYLSRKQAEIAELQNQVLQINSQNTDNDGYPDSEAVPENDIDSREMTHNTIRQMTNKEETDRRKTTDNLRLIDARGQFKPTPTNRHFTNAVQEDPDPHRMIEVTINGKRLTVIKSLYDFLGEDHYKNCELFASQEEYDLAEKKKAMERGKRFWSIYDKEKVQCINKQFRIWIKTLTLFKRGARLREVKALLNRIEEYIKSSDYRYLPKEYEHKDFIENTFLPKVKRLVISMEAQGNRHIQLVIDEVYQKQLEKVLMDIS